MSKANRNRLTTNITQSCFIKYSSIYFLLSYSWIISTEFFRAYYMDPVWHILEIFSYSDAGSGLAFRADYMDPTLYLINGVHVQHLERSSPNCAPVNNFAYFCFKFFVILSFFPILRFFFLPSTSLYVSLSVCVSLCLFVCVFLYLGFCVYV